MLGLVVFAFFILKGYRLTVAGSNKFLSSACVQTTPHTSWWNRDRSTWTIPQITAWMWASAMEDDPSRPASPNWPSRSVFVCLWITKKMEPSDSLNLHYAAFCRRAAATPDASRRSARPWLRRWEWASTFSSLFCFASSPYWVSSKHWRVFYLPFTQTLDKVRK